MRIPLGWLKSNTSLLCYSIAPRKPPGQDLIEGGEVEETKKRFDQTHGKWIGSRSEEQKGSEKGTKLNQNRRNWSNMTSWGTKKRPWGPKSDPSDRRQNVNRAPGALQERLGADKCSKRPLFGGLVGGVFDDFSEGRCFSEQKQINEKWCFTTAITSLLKLWCRFGGSHDRPKWATSGFWEVNKNDVNKTYKNNS